MSHTTPSDTLLTRFLLALCLYREARGEPLEGKRLVADVVLNRVADSRWPATVPGVILQRLQFSAFTFGDPNATLFPSLKSQTWAECVTVADAALADGPRSTANHYHTVDIAPIWADKDKITARIGHHVFYTL